MFPNPQPQSSYPFGPSDPLALFDESGDLSGGNPCKSDAGIPLFIVSRFELVDCETLSVEAPNFHYTYFRED